MSEKIPDELFLKCDCGSEVLNIELQDPYDDEYCIAIYDIDNKKLSWGQRFRYCWKTLSTGKPFNDQIMLHYTKIEKLQKYLKETEEWRVKSQKGRQTE